MFDDAAPLASSTPPAAATTTTTAPTSSFEPRVLFEPPPARAPVDDSALINDEDEPSVAEPVPELSVIDEEASSDISSGITSTLANVSLADVEVDQRSTNPLLSLLNVSYVRTEGDPELGDDDLSPHDHYAYAMASNDVRPLDWLNASLLTVPPSDYVSKGTNSQTIRGLVRMPELFLGLAKIYMHIESPLMGPYQTFKAAHDRVVALDTTPFTRSAKEELADLVTAMREHIVREQSEWDVYERRRPDGTVTRYTLPAGSLARFLAVYKALPTASQTYASTTIPILRAALVAIAIGGVPDWIYDKMVADVPISKSLLLYIRATDQAALFEKHVANFERYVKAFTRATFVSLTNNAKDIIAILRFRKYIGQDVVVDAKRIIDIARNGRTSLSLTAAKATNIASYDQALQQSALITYCNLLING